MYKQELLICLKNAFKKSNFIANKNEILPCISDDFVVFAPSNESLVNMHAAGLLK